MMRARGMIQAGMVVCGLVVYGLAFASPLAWAGTELMPAVNDAPPSDEDSSFGDRSMVCLQGAVERLDPGEQALLQVDEDQGPLTSLGPHQRRVLGQLLRKQQLGGRGLSDLEGHERPLRELLDPEPGGGLGTLGAETGLELAGRDDEATSGDNSAA